MGFFSWRTSDTGRSISNRYSDREVFQVHMITRDGLVWSESNYEGYGVFGGKDFYELLAELNSGNKKTREAGIDITFNNNPSGDYNGLFEMPKLVEDLIIDYNDYEDGEEELYKERFLEWFDSLPYPETCESQGFFYDSDDEDDDDDLSSFIY